MCCYMRFTKWVDHTERKNFKKTIRYFDSRTLCIQIDGSYWIGWACRTAYSSLSAEDAVWVDSGLLGAVDTGDEGG